MNKSPKSEFSLPLRIILVAPTSGVDFGIQEGKGHDYKTIQTQRAKESDLKFESGVSVKGDRTWEMIEIIENHPTKLLEATIPGTGKDGGPSCATVKPIDGWKVNVKSLG